MGYIFSRERTKADIKESTLVGLKNISEILGENAITVEEPYSTVNDFISKFSDVLVKLPNNENFYIYRDLLESSFDFVIIRNTTHNPEQPIFYITGVYGDDLRPYVWTRISKTMVTFMALHSLHLGREVVGAIEDYRFYLKGKSVKTTNTPIKEFNQFVEDIDGFINAQSRGFDEFVPNHHLLDRYRRLVNGGKVDGCYDAFDIFTGITKQHNATHRDFTIGHRSVIGNYCEVNFGFFSVSNNKSSNYHLTCAITERSEMGLFEFMARTVDSMRAITDNIIHVEDFSDL